MGERERRIGRNEALFRKLNERIEDVSRFLDPEAEAATFICECARGDCIERIRMTLARYAEIRSDPTLFFVLAGHEQPGVETVVERHDGWYVIRKQAGEPAQIAAETSLR
jgi:hypothetical protein